MSLVSSSPFATVGRRNKNKSKQPLHRMCELKLFFVSNSPVPRGTKRFFCISTRLRHKTISPQILLFFRPLSCYRFPAFLSRPNYVLGEILNKDIRFLSRTRGKGKGCVSNLEEILWRKKGVAWGDISFGKLVCFWPQKDWKGPSFGVIWISCILKRKGNGLITRFFGLDFRYCSFPVTQHFPTQVCTFSHNKNNAKQRGKMFLPDRKGAFLTLPTSNFPEWWRHLIYSTLPFLQIALS